MDDESPVTNRATSDNNEIAPLKTDVEAQPEANETDRDGSPRLKDEKEVADSKSGRGADAKFVQSDQTNYLPFRQLLIVFTGCGLAIMLSTLDQKIFATALPRISADFASGDQSSWVGTSYLLTSTAFQTLG
ncbi:hypothetical protein M427DRAFT_30476 [Gonapodya prolifera JEL478]|uniref:Major facilitator superfamily (MFS) profile domain-containing protein n=1 Tax=Gonapodya prolifera (strain JEL478) TaxID=1344416 RepID=A0A139AKK8_GONPJ|nr:hypothetical protein M427DRAFT_30476 [Gonapodya prolifera JEL478]|eukprot:KXS17332.1 hypothetical protein M427DRAFT_30476 [Gonapodya prolifera JEL478]